MGNISLNPIKLRARYEADNKNASNRFGYSMNVFYDIKIKQVNTGFYVKHIEDEEKGSPNTLYYESLEKLLNEWTLFKKYPN